MEDNTNEFYEKNGVKYPVGCTEILDKGFVRLVDFMGDDSSIVQAARVSYGKGTKKVSEDEGLIRYLMRHSHSTPFEMIEAKFHCRMPIFVARQWIRHRTACLSGDNTLYFDCPKGIDKIGKNGGIRRFRYNYNLKEFHDKFNSNKKNQYPLQSMLLRSCDENTGEIIHTNVRDIWESGVKDVYEIELSNGYKIKSSKDHLYLTSKGWRKLNEFIEIKEKSIFFDSKILLSTNGIPVYQDKDWLKNKYWNEKLNIDTIARSANISYHTIRKWLKIHDLQDKNYERFIGNKPGNFGKKYKLNLSEKQREEKRKIASKNAKRDKSSNFWKGGVTKERANIGRWTREQSQRVFRKYNFKCAITGRNDNLHSHHIDPVWHNKNKSLDFDNLICLCEEAHDKIHHLNLDLVFLDYFNQKKDLTKFFEIYNVKLKNPGKKRPNTRLIRKYISIKNVKYVGKEMTYDLEVSGPFHNFVCNGFVVHNSVNEMSGRYSEMPDMFYVPELDKMTKQSANNKQGGTDEIIDHTLTYQLKMHNEQKTIYNNYQNYLGTGMRKELARINLPLSAYTEWYWKIDLKNLFHFLKLRLDSHAQYEIRVFGEAMADLIKGKIPLAWKSFEDYQLNSMTLSSLEINALAKLLYGKLDKEVSYSQELEVNFTNKREREEFVSKLGKLASLANIK